MKAHKSNLKLNPFGKLISLINVFAAPPPYIIYTSTYTFSCTFQLIKVFFGCKHPINTYFRCRVHLFFGLRSYVMIIGNHFPECLVIDRQILFDYTYLGFALLHRGGLRLCPYFLLLCYIVTYCYARCCCKLWLLLWK